MAGNETNKEKILPNSNVTGNNKNSHSSALTKYKEETDVIPKRRLSLPSTMDKGNMSLNKILAKIPSDESIEDGSTDQKPSKRLSLTTVAETEAERLQNLREQVKQNAQGRRVSIAVGESVSQLRNLHRTARQKSLGLPNSKRRGSDLSIGSQRQLSRVSVEYHSKVPDGGYGWVVVAAASMVWCVAPGFTTAFGLFYVEFLRTFVESKSKTAWVGSVLFCMTLIGSPISSALSKKFGVRPVGFAGCIMTFVALIASTYASNVMLLMVSFGFFGGLGVGLMNTASLLCVAFYFDKKQSFAIGLTTCGIGVGSVWFPPLTEWLIKMYGWKGAVLITAAMILNCLVCFSFMKPLHSHKDKTSSWQEQLQQAAQPHETDTMSECFDGSDQQHSSSDVNVQRSNAMAKPIDSLEQQKIIKSDSVTDITNSAESGLCPDHRIDSTSNIKLEGTKCGDRNKGIKSKAPLERLSKQSRRKFHKEDINIFWQHTLDVIDFTFLLNPVFVYYVTMCSMTAVGIRTSMMFIIDFSLSLGISETIATLLVSIIGVMSVLGRLAIGKLLDAKPKTDPVVVHAVCKIVCGVASIISTFVKQQVLYFCFAVILGTVAGVNNVLTTAMAVDLVGMDHMGTVMSLGMMGSGLAVLTLVPFAGWLYDVTQSYNATYTFSGSAFILSGVMAFTFRVFAKCMNKNKDIV